MGKTYEPKFQVGQKIVVTDPGIGKFYEQIGHVEAVGFDQESRTFMYIIVYWDEQQKRKRYFQDIPERVCEAPGIVIPTGLGLHNLRGKR